MCVKEQRREHPKMDDSTLEVLCQKYPSKGNAFDNYRPISCLPLLWKLMAGTIALQFS